MISKATTVSQYLQSLPVNRQEAMAKMRMCLAENLPMQLKEQMMYGMISYVIPLEIYPLGYHASEGEPLPFVSLASQKNYISLYHMGIYMDEAVKKWFVYEYQKRSSTKLDIGKSCIRFKKIEQIPYELIAELCHKISVEDYIKLYESSIKNR